MTAQPDDHPKHMTQAEREALPWYGGNKIPDSYLKKFQRAVVDEGIPYEMRLFIDTQLGNT